MRLRRDFCLGGLANLPTTSIGWRPDRAAQLEMLRDYGYAGVIHWEGWDDIHRAGLIPCGMACVRTPEAAIEIARRHQGEGLDFTTLHVGSGFETDAAMDKLAASVLDASSRTGYALHIETHRATMTQDIRRTLDLLLRFPELPLTLDFSHWYCGHELTYGGEFEERLAILDPLFANVRSIQLRFGSPGQIQMPLDLVTPWLADHLRTVDRCFTRLMGQLIQISCAPELLPARIEGGRWIGYGEADEQSDRFADALTVSELAESRYRALILGAGARHAPDII